MTGESEASESDVRLAKCHSDHLKVKDTHTESGWEGERGGQKMESRVSRVKPFPHQHIHNGL